MGVEEGTLRAAGVFDPNRPEAIEQPSPLALVTDKVNLWATYVGGAIAVASMAVIGGLLVVSVVLRFAFNTSLGFAVELPTYLFPWLIAGGVVAAMGRGGHIAVDYFVGMTPKALQRWIDVLVWALTTAALAYLCYLATLMVQPFSTQNSPILGLPQITSFGGYLYMAVSLTIQAGARLYTALKGPIDHPGGLGV